MKAPRSTLHRDRGAMAIAIAVSTLMLAGFAAIVIDVGGLYEERRDLQNGADAAALAVAIDCAQGVNCTPASAQPIADQYADANANDGAARVLQSEIVFDSNEVTVTARTDDAGPNTDGDTNTLDHFFARIWGNLGTEVGATASARWGAPGSSAALPITFSVCEWDQLTGGGSTFPSPYAIIYLHNTNGNGGTGGPAGDCLFGPGQDIDGDGDRGPGGFGYLETSTPCSANISVGGFVEGRNGTGNPQQVLGCDLSDILHNTLLIPIFDDLVDASYCAGAPNGHNCYHVYGFAGFYVEDVDFNGNPWRNNGNICASSDRCLGGYFERFVSLEEGLEILGGGGPDLGVTVVHLSG